MSDRTRESRACPACGARSSKAFGSVGGFDLVRCSACSTVRTSTLPEPGEEEDYSAYYHEGNLQVPEFIERRLEQVVAGFARFRSNGRWLDIGCGAGTLMAAAARQGWTAIGTEVSGPAVESVRRRGFEVHLGALDEIPLEESSFDVVSLVEVIEHVPEPGAVLGAAARLVRPGGAVYVTTPNAGSISARLIGARWSAVVPPEHLQLFSVRGLRTLLERARLTVLRLDAHAVNPHELRDALLRRELVYGGERVADAYELNESLSQTRSGQILKASVNRLLSLTRLGDALKAVGVRCG